MNTEIVPPYVYMGPSGIAILTAPAILVGIIIVVSIYWPKAFASVPTLPRISYRRFIIIALVYSGAFLIVLSWNLWGPTSLCTYKWGGPVGFLAAAYCDCVAEYSSMAPYITFGVLTMAYLVSRNLWNKSKQTKRPADVTVP